VSVTVKIENTYEDGHRSTFDYEVEDPEGSSENLMDDWWENEVFPLTGDKHGAKHPKLGANYEATVIRADDEKLVGLSREWD
jgi:hypothetical protein